MENPRNSASPKPRAVNTKTICLGPPSRHLTAADHNSNGSVSIHLYLAVAQISVDRADTPFTTTILALAPSVAALFRLHCSFPPKFSHPVTLLAFCIGRSLAEFRNAGRTNETFQLAVWRFNDTRPLASRLSPKGKDSLATTSSGMKILTGNS